MLKSTLGFSFYADRSMMTNGMHVSNRTLVSNRLSLRFLILLAFVHGVFICACMAVWADSSQVSEIMARKLFRLGQQIKLTIWKHLTHLTKQGTYLRKRS